MYSRRDLKRKGLQSLRKHYIIFAAVCLLAVFLGVGSTDVSGGAGLVSSQKDAVEGLAQNGRTTVEPGLLGVIQGSSVGRLLDESKVLGRSRGVFAALLNMTSSGTIVMTFVSAVMSFGAARNVALGIVIFLSALLAAAVWIFLINIYQVVSARIFLEGRVYERVPVQRTLFLLHVKKWMHASLAMLLMVIYQTLWGLTIVGGFIKAFSYRMVPYIIAENPAISARRAITLSRRMMYGHKLECFRLELSFLGWWLLNIITFGISGLIFSRPYREAVFSEYYAYVREIAKKTGIEGSEYLEDEFLFRQAGKELLREKYADVAGELGEPLPEFSARGGIFGFIADVFGVVLFCDRKEQEYEAHIARKIAKESLRDRLEGRAYPDRLSPLPIVEKRKKIETVHYVRHYSVLSLVLLFFTFSVIGWIWEVSLHLISDGVFVNRGVLHGPWLPIYGTGGVLILILLNKFRSRPIVEFFSAIVLCGCVEYYVSWYLEMTHNGQKWWDYSGYFLNLHGRICAEGLLVFGAGGMAIVYVVAPLLDNLFRRIRLQIIIPVCAALLIVYTGDQMYSSKHPNTGEGITSYTLRTPRDAYPHRGKARV